MQRIHFNVPPKTSGGNYLLLTMPMSTSAEWLERLVSEMIAPCIKWDAKLTTIIRSMKCSDQNHPKITKSADTKQGTGSWTEGSERDKVKVTRLQDAAQTLAIQIPPLSYVVTKNNNINNNNIYIR